MSTSIAPALTLSGKKMNYIFSDTKILLSPGELTMHIKRCALNDRDSQKKIYTTFYGFSMAICKRYTNNQDDAIEILNDGFLKIFREIHRYNPAYADVLGSFKGWLRKVMMRTAIDHFRKNKKHRFTVDANNGIIQLSDKSEDALARISYREILRSIQELSPAYRTVLSLFIIEGRKHQEISAQLGISIGASKSNLAKARIQLQKILFQRDLIQLKKGQEGYDSDKRPLFVSAFQSVPKQ
jgi:RNA polymerase sigma factor (sigma-70 family)